MCVCVLGMRVFAAQVRVGICFTQHTHLSDGDTSSLSSRLSSSCSLCEKGVSCESEMMRRHQVPQPANTHKSEAHTAAETPISPGSLAALNAVLCGVEGVPHHQRLVQVEDQAHLRPLQHRAHQAGDAGSQEPAPVHRQLGAVVCGRGGERGRGCAVWCERRERKQANHSTHSTPALPSHALSPWCDTTGPSNSSCASLMRMTRAWCERRHSAWWRWNSRSSGLVCVQADERVCQWRASGRARAITESTAIHRTCLPSSWWAARAERGLLCVVIGERGCVWVTSLSAHCFCTPADTHPHNRGHAGTQTAHANNNSNSSHLRVLHAERAAH